MKSLKFIVLSLSAALVMASCGGGSTPESVVEGFNSAMMAMDYDKAKTFCTKESAPALDAMKNMPPMSDEMKAQIAEMTKNTKVEILGSEISADKLTATVKTKTTVNGQSFDAPVSLKMEDGAWKVSLAAPAVEATPEPEVPATDSTATAATTETAAPATK